MTTTLSEEWAAFVREQISSGRYGSPEEVIEAALNLLRRRNSGTPRHPSQRHSSPN